MWEYSLENEAMKVVHDAHYVVTGFSKINNFVVLPYGDLDASSSVDWFPDIPVAKIPRFWERAKHVDVYQIPIKTDEKLIREVLELLKEVNLNEPRVNELKKLWEKAEHDVVTSIENYVFGKTGNIKSITIYPTHFGNRTSFAAPKEFPAEFKIFVREDADLYTIGEAILTCATRRKMEEELSASWRESEVFVDWNLLHGPVGETLKRFQPNAPAVLTLEQISDVQKARVIKKSDEFYRKLGVPKLEKIFNDKILNLSGQSQKIFELLKQHQNEVVSVDDLGAVLFDNEEDFSLYAISKAIERLRNKLEENGISGTYIQAFRGQGYMLRN